MHRQGSLTGNHNAKPQFAQTNRYTEILYCRRNIDDGAKVHNKERCKKESVNEPLWHSVDHIQAPGDVPVYLQCGIGTVVAKLSLRLLCQHNFENNRWPILRE